MIPAHFCSPLETPSTLLAALHLTAGLATAAPSPALAQAASAGSTLSVEKPRGLWLTTPYPEFSVQAGKEISVNLNLANRGLPPQRVEFDVGGLPTGWKWEPQSPVPTTRIAGTIAAVLVLFTLAYVSFQRQEISA